MKIDIIMATRNGRQYLKEQIDSILNQTFTDFRLIIRDDASSDGTVDLLSMYQTLYPDKIKIVGDGTASGSAKNNFFLLMKESEADYVMFADQDDVWESNKVEEAYRYIRSREKKVGKDKPILCHGDPKVVNEKLEMMNESMGKVQKLDYKRKKLRHYLVQNNLTGCTTIANRKLIDLCEEMPEEAIMHDWWLALIASAFGRVMFMGEAHMLYRQHGNNTEGVKNLRSPIYLIKKLFDRKNVKKSLELTYSQAEKFYEIFGDRLEMKDAETVKMFCSMKNKRKLSKILTMTEYRFSKSGLSRELGYILFI